MTVEHSRAQLARAMTEDDLKEAVIGEAQLRGWLVHHCRPARAAAGKWSTPIEGDPGFVDLVLVHPRHGVLWRELKSQRGRLDDDQRRWLAALSSSGADAKVWRPIHWVEGSIDLELRGKAHVEIHVTVAPAPTFEEGFAAGLHRGRGGG